MAFFELQNIEIKALASAVPKSKTNLEELKSKFGEDALSLWEKAGVEETRISVDLQTTSDLGFIASEKIISNLEVDVNEIGFVVFLSRTPDYRSPATATVLQNRLNIPQDCIVYDINIGNMGFIYGLQIAGSLLLSINKPYGLFVVGDTISKQLSYDKAQSMIYGDGASAVLLGKNDGAERINTLSNSQGDGYDKYYLPEGGFRDFKSLFEVNRNIRSQNIKMYEQEYFSFVKEILPKSINRFMDKHQSSIKNFDFLALHQEHAEVLSGLCKKLNIDFKHLPSNINKYGNSSGNSIPLLLTDYFGKAKNKEKIKVLAIAYGEGFSWGMASFSINTNNIFPLLESDEYYDDAKVSHDF